jgi:hypothetical protein
VDAAGRTGSYLYDALSGQTLAILGIGGSSTSRLRPVCYLPECWPREMLKRVEEYRSSRFLVVSHEPLALLSFPVVLRDYTLVTLDP